MGCSQFIGSKFVVIGASSLPHILIITIVETEAATIISSDDFIIIEPPSTRPTSFGRISLRQSASPQLTSLLDTRVRAERGKAP